MTTATENIVGQETCRSVYRNRGRGIFAYRKPMTCSQWADTYRKISPIQNPQEPGPWRTSRVPYLREIMDTVCSPDVERVVFMKSARVGGTEVTCNAIGYYVHHEPSNIMIVQPTVEDGKGFSKENLEPTIRETPVLRESVWTSDPDGRRDRRDTILQKMYPGGYMVAIGAKSAAGFRRRNIQRLFLEEVDGYPDEAVGSSYESEGDPILLGIKRTQNFDDRTIYENSTPHVEGRSRIDFDYKLSDQRRYHVPCPYCEYMQVLRWANMLWEDGKPETVKYRCGEVDEQTGEITAGCGELISEDHKGRMLAAGEWRAQRPGRKIVGFHIWAAYSPFTSWTRLVTEFLDAQGNSEALQVFVNTVLGETWREKGEEISEEGLRARRAPYVCPAGICVLVMATDVQGDRLESSVWGFGRGYESWLVTHEILWGDPAIMTGTPGAPSCWELHDALLARSWMSDLGVPLQVYVAVVDSGGHHTNEVYKYCKARERRGVFPVKGGSEPGKAAVSKPTEVGRGINAKLFTLGTETLKDTIFGRLKIEVMGPGYVHLPTAATDEYITQLTNEHRVTTMHRGRAMRRYMPKRPGLATEGLDCYVYATAALEIGGILRPEHLSTRADLLLAQSKRAKVEPERAETRPEQARPNVAARMRNRMRNFGGGL